MIDRTKYLMLGGGKLYIALKNDAGYDDFKYFGLTNDVKASISTETLEHKNTEDYTEETDYEVVKSKDIKLSFSTDEISQEMLALAFIGEKVVVNQANANVTDETIANVKQGYRYNLENINVSNVVVTSEDGNTTYQEGTDYTVDYGAGAIFIVEGGSIANGSTIKVDYTAGAIDYSKVYAATKDKIECMLKFVSEPTAGIRREWTFFKVSLSANGDIFLKSATDWASINFEGKALKDNTRTTGSKFFEVKEIATNA